MSTFFGYFLLGPVLFSTAFIVGGGACFVAVRAAMNSSDASAWLSVVAMLVGGGLSGFSAIKMLAVGMFAVGAAFGVALSAALKAALWSRVFPNSPHAGFIFGSVLLGMTFGVVALTLRKKMLILSTSYAGAFALFFGIGHFAGHFPSLKQLNQVEQGMFDPFAVLYLGLTALVGTAGLFLQLHLTRDKVMPRRAPYSRYRRHRRVRASSRGSAWSLGDEEEYERDLLAGERLQNQNSGAGTRSLRAGPVLDIIPKPVLARDLETGEKDDADSSGSGSWSATNWTAAKKSEAADSNLRSEKVITTEQTKQDGEREVADGVPDALARDARPASDVKAAQESILA